ncbi:MAG: YdgA family protein [Campylobacteraceae bacterium]|jgi:hypothetical protein|nr:YdgA family protein [Campylobacteraceae bacterium]
MKKIAIFVLVLLILISGYFIFGVYYTNKKINAFFNHDNGVLYESAGLKWKLAESKTTLLEGNYKTEVSLDNKPFLVLEHEVVFGMRFNPFKIGSINTKGKIISSGNDEIPEILQQEFNVKSNVIVGGIDGSIVINGGNISTYNIYSGENDNITWQNTKADFFISFKRDKFNFDADIPLIKFEGAFGEFFVLEEQKYKSRSIKKEGLWMGNSDIAISKVELSDKYSMNFLLSNLKINSNVDTGKSSTITNINKISFGELKYSDIESAADVSFGDIVLNFNLENLDLESMKKITEAVQKIDPTNSNQASFVVLSLFGYMSNILAKHPKITVEEFSGKYANQSAKMSGFVQYVGDGDLMNVYANLNKDIDAKIDFEFMQEVLRKYFEQKTGTNYYGYDPEDDEAFQEALNEEINLSIEAFEEDTGMRPENGLYKGTLEFKRGDFFLNGRIYKSVTEYGSDFTEYNDNF